MSSVLVIPDLHAPFIHKRAMRCVQWAQDWYQTDHTVFIGDIVDQYFASRFQKDPAQSGPWEIAAARKQINRWSDEFYEADVCIGNHDERVAKRCEEAGVPGCFLKDYAAVWDTPGWNWKDQHIIDGVLYIHGTGWSGVTAARRAALEHGRCVVMGHCHKFGGVMYINQKGKRKQLWGMNVGWLGDEKAYGFAYGKTDAIAGTLGCGVVIDGEPHFVPMR